MRSSLTRESGAPVGSSVGITAAEPPTESPKVKAATGDAPRACHVNSGTSVPRDQLAWPETTSRVFRLPKTGAVALARHRGPASRRLGVTETPDRRHPVRVGVRPR